MNLFKTAKNICKHRIQIILDIRPTLKLGLRRCRHLAPDEHGHLPDPDPYSSSQADLFQPYAGHYPASKKSGTHMGGIWF